MSATALDSRPTPLASPRISRGASEPVAAHPTCSDDPPAPRITETEANDPLVFQLGRLASQHHTSDYNRLKFGPNGSPLVYVPYSVQMPDHYKEMQDHQSRCAEQRAWWPSGEPSPASRIAPAKVPPAEVSTDPGDETHLREELSAAISAPLDIPPQQQAPPHTPQPQPHWQTSETHPIVISTIIPLELLPIISSHLEHCANDYPTKFKLPRSYLLDRAMPRPVEPPAPIPVPPPVIPQTLPSCPLPRPSNSYSITKSLKLPNFFWVHPSVRRAFLGNAVTSRSSTGKRPRPASFAASSNPSYPDIVVEHNKRPAVTRNSSSPIVLKASKELDASIATAVLQEVNIAVQRPHPARLPNAPLIRPPGIALPAIPRIPPIGTPSVLGNLLMSSCPGKKVRLDGPVRGRNTVCRDLTLDLRRIKDTGAACLVCLLDDNEMQSLGVAWADYVRVAGELGMDVLRIPIPEGLPPNDPALLDSHLAKLIDSYTLRGSSILVHCRGGVGRAGIIACCWMLKLGLCGWLDSDVLSPAVEDADDPLNVPPSEVDPDTMRLVERLIIVVRRRRSPKAIETYEQVKFLVDYVEFLRRQGEPQRERSSPDWFADWETRVE
ncbi:phosphatases II [Trametes polyzona]|nr:phosphatases II [Trametes polyzona]